MSLTVKHFCLTNIWTEDSTGPKFKYQPKFCKWIIDKSTEDKYLNEDIGSIREKCAALSIGTTFVHTIAGIPNIIIRIVRLISFYNFWKKMKNTSSYDFWTRAKDAGLDLLRIITQPVAIIGLQLSAIYGIFRPHDGRKLYASIERAQYGRDILAPCFQPRRRRTFFGEEIAGNREAW